MVALFAVDPNRNATPSMELTLPTSLLIASTLELTQGFMQARLGRWR
jgi:hypothetical protein